MLLTYLEIESCGIIICVFIFICRLHSRGSPYNDGNRSKFGDVAIFENRQPVTSAKFIIKTSLFILLPGVIRRLELKAISEQKKSENIFVARHLAKPILCLQFNRFISRNKSNSERTKGGVR